MVLTLGIGVKAFRMLFQGRVWKGTFASMSFYRGSIKLKKSMPDDKNVFLTK